MGEESRGMLWIYIIFRFEKQNSKLWEAKMKVLANMFSRVDETLMYPV